MDEILPKEYVEEKIKSREEAEANGLYDTILTYEQEATLAQACSSLSQLCRETNLSIEELLKLTK